MKDEGERVNIEAFLKKNEYPVILDLLEINNELDDLSARVQSLKEKIDKSVCEHTGVKIERRKNGERRNGLQPQPPNNSSSDSGLSDSDSPSHNFADD